MSQSNIVIDKATFDVQIVVNLLEKIGHIEKQRDNLLSALKLISECKTCPAVLAQLAINAINEVKE